MSSRTQFPIVLMYAITCHVFLACEKSWLFLQVLDFAPYQLLAPTVESLNVCVSHVPIPPPEKDDGLDVLQA